MNALGSDLVVVIKNLDIIHSEPVELVAEPEPAALLPTPVTEVAESTPVAEALPPAVDVAESITAQQDRVTDLEAKLALAKAMAAEQAQQLADTQALIQQLEADIIKHTEEQQQLKIQAIHEELARNSCRWDRSEQTYRDILLSIQEDYERLKNLQLHYSPYAGDKG